VTLNHRIVVISGGLGGARFAMGLKEAGLDRQSSFVTNVADDVVVDDLVVCPDTDAVSYAFTGIFDDKRGWGIAGDRFSHPSKTHPWFAIGDMDRSWQRRRQRLLSRGMPLHEAIRACAVQMGIRATIVPATNSEVRTRIVSRGTALGFQEWLVRDGARMQVDEMGLAGIDDAEPSPGVLPAIEEASVIVIAPSSPAASIRPIISVRGVTEALAQRRDIVVAVSPIASKLPLVLERDQRRAHARAVLMEAVGIPHEPIGVARSYRRFISRFVLDRADGELEKDVASLDVDVRTAPTVGSTPQARAELLSAVLDQSWLATG